MTGPEDQIPGKSPGVMAAPFLGATAVYDMLTHRVTLVSPLAGVLLEVASMSRAEQAFIDELADDVLASTGAPKDAVVAALCATVDGLVEANLLGRPTVWDPDPVVGGAPLVQGHDGSDTPSSAGFGSTLHVFDERLAFRSADADLLADIDRWLHLPPGTDEPTVVFDADPTPVGGVFLQAAEVWEFPDRSGFQLQLPGVVNDWAARSSTLLVLHAGGLRTPDGSVVLLPGVPEAGKSTMTAAFVAAGCDYLGDELVAVRPDSLQAVGFPGPFSLDDTSRRVLGLESAASNSPYAPLADVRHDAQPIAGDAGAVTQLIIPIYDALLGAPEIQTLSPRDALEVLLRSVMNLARCGEDGWRTLCQLVERVPTRIARHPDAPSFARSELRPRRSRGSG